MKFDFEDVLRPVNFYEAAHAMSRLRKKTSSLSNTELAISDDIPTYCTVGQVSESGEIDSEETHYEG